MTKSEHLLTILAEECAEVAQRVSKALRFGLDEVQHGQTQTNAERLEGEFFDLMAAYHHCIISGVLPEFDGSDAEKAIEKKIAKVERYMKVSASRGTISDLGVSLSGDYTSEESVRYDEFLSRNPNVLGDRRD